MRIDHPRGVACCAIDLAAVCVCVCVSVSVWFCPRSRVRACAVVACWLFVRAPSIRAGRLSRRVGLRGAVSSPSNFLYPHRKQQARQSESTEEATHTHTHTERERERDTHTQRERERERERETSSDQRILHSRSLSEWMAVRSGTAPREMVMGSGAQPGSGTDRERRSERSGAGDSGHTERTNLH